MTKINIMTKHSLSAHPLVVLLSLSTVAGVLLHDIRIDKAAQSVFAPASVASNYDGSVKLFAPDFHAHSERDNFSQLVHDLKLANPRIHPRTQEDKKHLMQKYATRGHQFFDNYNLPI